MNNTTTYQQKLTLIAVIIAAVVTTTTTLPAATAQLPEEVAPPDSVNSYEANPEAASLAIGIATSVLWNLTDREPSVTLSEDGTMQIIKIFNAEHGSVYIHVIAPHNLTPENGYHIDNGVLYAPNGTQVFP